MTTPEGDSLRRIIVSVFPEFETAAFRFITTGWHSTAVDVDDRWIFKFPRHEEAAIALRREASLLREVRPAITMAVPDLRLHEGPPLFSRHEKLAGGHLLPHEYERLTASGRQALAEDLALFYQELHRMDRSRMTALGALPIKPWQSLETIRNKAVPLLPPELQRYAADAIARFAVLPADPLGDTYGFFDGHGWNMAFDHATEKLNGIYDFADSGFGPKHQEFIYSNFISPDLTDRLVSAYEKLTGLTLDRPRIGLLTGIHRLSELAELANDPVHVPAMIRHVADWAENPGCFP